MKSNNKLYMLQHVIVFTILYMVSSFCFSHQFKKTYTPSGKSIKNLSDEVRKSFILDDVTKEEYLSFPFGNEFPENYGEHVDYKENISALQLSPPVKNSTPRVAILIGNSSVHASLPELKKHSDIVLLIDSNLAMNHWNDCFLDYLKNTNDSNINQMSSNLIDKCSLFFERSNPAIDDVQQDYNRLGVWHPMHNQNRLMQSKKALSALKVISINMNIFDKFAVKKLSNILNKYHAIVTILNFSNVLEWNSSPEYSVKDEFVTWAHGTSLDAFMEFPISHDCFLFISRLSKGVFYTALEKISNFEELEKSAKRHGYDPYY